MYKKIIFLLLFLPFYSSAQQSKNDTRVFTIDSFTTKELNDDQPRYYFLDTGWRFQEGDSVSMASIDYDDSKWDIVNSQLYKKIRPAHSAALAGSVFI